MKKYILSVLFILFFITTVSGSTINSQYDSFYLKADLINQNPDPANAGTIIDLRFFIQNQGVVEANNLKVTLVSKYPFSELEGYYYTKDILKIFPFQDEDNSQILKYSLLIDESTPAGTYEVSLVISKEDSNSKSIYTFDIEVNSKEYAQVVTISKSSVDFGSIENLDFLITNTGTSPIKNIVFTWSESTDTILPVMSDNSKYISYLGVGESIELNYKIMANINSTPGLYKLNLNLNFENELGEFSEIISSAGLFVGGITDFDLSVSDNSSGSLSLAIANIGNNPAYSVTVSIPTQKGVTISGSNSSILGNIDQGDYTIASYSINGTIKNSFLNVLIDYTDSLGVRNSILKEIDLNQDNNESSITFDTNFDPMQRNVSGIFPQQPNNKSNWYVYVLIALVIFGGSYFLFKFSSKNKKIIK